MDWDKLRIFHAAAEAGTFTHASETLQMSQSAVSRQVSSLEKDLGIPLFHRHARGLALTEQGEMLHATVAEVMNKLQAAELLLSETTTKPAGELRVTVPVGLGTVWVTQRIREFIELYPEIRIELILSDEQMDLSMRAADVALFIYEPEQSDLIRRPLFSMNVRAYASAAYIRKFGAPQNLAALSKHRIVSYSGPPAQHLTAITWVETAGLKGKETRQPAFRVNSIMAMKYAIRSGVGIGMLPDYLVEGDTDLVPVLTELEPPKMTIYFVYAEEMKGSKRVQVFRDFLVGKSRQWRH
jgi:DNA-binding transcriptional LysR family regulator